MLPNYHDYCEIPSVSVSLRLYPFDLQSSSPEDSYSYSSYREAG